MSQSNNGGENNGKLLVDLDDDDEDDFDISSDEVEIGEDERLMDEFIRMDRESDLRASKRMIRSQTEDNTLENSGEIILYNICVGYNNRIYFVRLWRYWS